MGKPGGRLRSQCRPSAGSPLRGGGRAAGDSRGEDVALVEDGRVAVVARRCPVSNFPQAGKRALENVGCSPAGLAAGPGGDLYVAAPCDNAVRRYSAAGSVTKYSGGADRATRLDQPVDVAVSPDGTIYVADLRHRIVEIDPATDTVRRSWPVHVGVAHGAAKLSLSKGTLYLTDPDRDALFVVDTATGGTMALPDTSVKTVGAFARGAGLGQCLSGFSTKFDGFGRCAGELLARCGEGTKWKWKSETHQIKIETEDSGYLAASRRGIGLREALSEKDHFQHRPVESGSVSCSRPRSEMLSTLQEPRSGTLDRTSSRLSEQGRDRRREGVAARRRMDGTTRGRREAWHPPSSARSASPAWSER